MIWHLLKDRGMEVRGNKLVLNGLLIANERIPAVLAVLTARVLQIGFGLRFDQLSELLDKPEQLAQHLWSGQAVQELLSGDEIAVKIKDKFKYSTIDDALASFSAHRLALKDGIAERLFGECLPNIINDLELPQQTEDQRMAKLNGILNLLTEINEQQLTLDFLSRLEKGESSLPLVAEALGFLCHRYPQAEAYHLADFEFNLRWGACDSALAACRALAALSPQDKTNAGRFARLGAWASANGAHNVAFVSYQAAASFDKAKGYEQKAKAAEKTGKGAKEKAGREESAKLLAAWKKAEKDPTKHAAELYDLINGDLDKVDLIAAKPSLNFVSRKSACALFRRLEELAIERENEPLAEFYLYQQNVIISSIFEQVARNNAIDQERADIIYELLKEQQVAEIDQTLAEALFAVAKDKTKRYHLLAKDILWNYGFDAANEAYAKGLGVKCLAHLLICQELRPEDHQVKHNLSVVLTYLGVQFIEIDEYAEAEKYFRRALENEPNCFPALEQLGYLLAKRGALDEAEAVCRRALDVEVNRPNEQQTHRLAVGRAQVYNNLFAVALNRFEASSDEVYLDPAEKYLQQAIAILPQVKKFRYNLAVAQLLKGDFAAALGWMADYQAGEEVNPTWVLSFIRQVARRLALHETDRGNEQIGRYLADSCDYLMGLVQTDPANKQLADDLAQLLEGYFYLGYPMIGAKGLDYFMAPEWAGSEAQACALRVKEYLANPVRT